MTTNATYRGRFAPTPSGPLHLGSLLTALASYLQAKSQQGLWLLRIDDLDQQRIDRGSSDEILRQLEKHGLLWDEAPRYESDHIAEYDAALEALKTRGLLYGCTCTRAQLHDNSLPGPDGAVYVGSCRERGLSTADAALRLKLPDEDLVLQDGWQGRHARHLKREIGDFVVRRRDGIIAYQLACAVDEHSQGITEVVRGADLIGSTFRQVFVMRTLGLREPDYRHLPVLVDAHRRKLSKQNHALALDETRAGANLVRCLEWLGQRPPPALVRSSPTDILLWARQHWNPAGVPRTPELQTESL